MTPLSFLNGPNFKFDCTQIVFSHAVRKFGAEFRLRSESGSALEIV